MKTKQKMTFLRKERVQGVSSKTGNPYDFTLLCFLDDEFQEAKIILDKEFHSDLTAIAPMKMCDVLLSFSFGQRVNVSVLSVNPV